MDKQFWLGKWERGETGWHQAEVEPGLVAHFPKASPGTAPIRVLVPLCGKSLDLGWLASQGHEVVGVELSELATRAFFSENSMPFKEEARDGFRIFKSGRITILQGDFFALTPELLGPIGAVYDRAALIALPPETRRKYAAHLRQLITRCGGAGLKQLQIVLERTPADPNGPPFSVSESEIRDLYLEFFGCRPLGREVLSEEDGRKVEECIYLLER